MKSPYATSYSLTTNWHPISSVSELSQLIVQILDTLCFWATLCSSFAHWKVHSGLPISVNWTFLPGVIAEALWANTEWKSAILLQRGQLDPKISGRRGHPTKHSSSQKTRLNGLSYGIKIWTDLSSILWQITHLTNGQTASSWLNRAACNAHSAVKVDQPELVIHVF